MRRQVKQETEKAPSFEMVIGELLPLVDTPFHLNINLGETKMTIQDLLDLEVGSIVELRKSAGEPMEVLVKDRVVMKGEVTVLEDSLGLRIVEIVDISQRV
jgi:flagellar motor switch protein FliN/FliY